MRSKLDWRWIAIGVVIMFGLNLLTSFLLVPLLGDSVPAADADPQAMAEQIGGGRLALGALLAIASFVIGGFIVGLKSAGRTILEPAISAAIAVLISLLLTGAFSLGNLLLGGLVPFLAALLGGYLGERVQAGRAGSLRHDTPVASGGSTVPPPLNPRRPDPR